MDRLIVAEALVTARARFRAVRLCVIRAMRAAGSGLAEVAAELREGQAGAMRERLADTANLCAGAMGANLQEERALSQAAQRIRALLGSSSAGKAATVDAAWLAEHEAECGAPAYQHGRETRCGGCHKTMPAAEMIK